MRLLGRDVGRANQDRVTPRQHELGNLLQLARLWPSSAELLSSNIRSRRRSNRQKVRSRALPTSSRQPCDAHLSKESCPRVHAVQFAPALTPAHPPKL